MLRKCCRGRAQWFGWTIQIHRGLCMVELSQLHEVRCSRRSSADHRILVWVADADQLHHHTHGNVGGLRLCKQGVSVSPPFLNIKWYMFNKIRPYRGTHSCREMSYAYSRGRPLEGGELKLSYRGRLERLPKSWLS